MKKLRYGPMALTVVVAVGAFLLAQRFDLIPGPWSNRPTLLSSLRAAGDDGGQDYMYFYRRGVSLVEQRQFDRALVEFDEAVKLRPTPLALKDLGERVDDSRVPETHTLHTVGLVYTARADVLLHMNRPEEALADLDQVLAFDGRKTDVYYQRGMLKLAVGRYQDAVADFDAALAARRNVQWVFARGLAKYVQADWTGAIKDFERATRIAPGEQSYLIWLAKTYLRAGIPLPAEPFAAVGKDSDARYVIEAFLSDYNPAQFMPMMRAGAAYVDNRRRSIQCETALFAGEWLVVRKKGKGARDMFHEAAASCQPLSVEHAVAVAELQRVP